MEIFRYERSLEEVGDVCEVESLKGLPGWYHAVRTSIGDVIEEFGFGGPDKSGDVYRVVSYSERTQNAVATKATRPETIRKFRRAISFFDLLRDENSWIEDWYEDRKQMEDYKEKGRKALKEFYKKYEKELVVPKYLEQFFNLRIKENTVIGVIDRIDEIGKNEVELVDYKTGKVRDKLYPEDKEQLLIYQMAVEQIFPENPVKLSYYYIEGNKKVSFLGTAKDLIRVENKIIKIIGDIKESSFPATPSKQKCKFCDFKGICEHKVL